MTHMDKNIFSARKEKKKVGAGGRGGGKAVTKRPKSVIQILKFNGSELNKTTFFHHTVNSFGD